MKMTTAALAAVCSLLVSASAMAVQVPFINGYAFFDNYNTVPVNNGNVRICSHPYVDSTCYAVTTQYTGQYYANYISFPDDSTIYIFAWIDAPYAADGRDVPVNLVPNTPYNWKVVAKALHPGGVLTTESVVFHFNTGN